MFRVPGNADHREQLAPYLEATAYRIRTRPVAHGGGLIDDYDTRCSFVVVVREITTGYNRNAHSREKSGSYVGTSYLMRLVQLRYISFGIDVAAVAVEAKRQPVSEPCDLNSRHNRYPIENLVLDRVFVAGRIARDSKTDRSGQDMVLLKAGVGVIHVPERAQEQTGRN